MIRNRTIQTTLLLLLITASTFAQNFPKQAIKKKLKASKIEMDGGNGDGVFKAKSKKTKKWGMYQWMYEGTQVKEMIPMNYDSLKYFPFNGNFTAVYQNGKAGFYLCEWSYGEDATQTVECKYDDYKRVNVREDRYSNPTLYLAVKRDNKWGWVNWISGEEKTAFLYDTYNDIPFPTFVQSYSIPKE